MKKRWELGGVFILLVTALSACGPLHEARPFDQKPTAKAPPSAEVKFERLSGQDLERAEHAVRLATREYPAGFLSKMSVSVEPVASLCLRGQKAAGVTDSNRIFVDYTPTDGRAFDDIQAFATVHHEVAHVALDRFLAKFPRVEWLKALPSGFEYREKSGKPAPIDAGDAMADWDLREVRRGFLVEESKESIDEDFACIAEELFRNDTLFWHATSLSPMLKTKVDLAIGFYQSMDPCMTREWFRALPHPFGEQTRSMNLFSFP